MRQSPAQKAFANRLKTIRHIRHEKVVLGWDPQGIREFLFRQQLGRDHRHGFRRINQMDIRTQNILEKSLEQRIMSAPQDQRVDMFSDHRFEILLGCKAGHRMIQPALLYKRYKERTGLRINPDIRIIAVNGPGIGIAVNGGRCSDNADIFAVRFGCGDTGTGINDIEHRNRRNLLNRLIGNGGNGVTGNDQQLDLLFQEEFSNLGGIPRNGFDRFDAVRDSGRVTKIDDIFKEPT